MFRCCDLLVSQGIRGVLFCLPFRQMRVSPLCRRVGVAFPKVVSWRPQRCFALCRRERVAFSLGTCSSRRVHASARLRKRDPLLVSPAFGDDRPCVSKDFSCVACFSARLPFKNQCAFETRFGGSLNFLCVANFPQRFSFKNQCFLKRHTET